MSADFTIDLDSFRWRNDDGTEATATYNQDINIAIVVGDEGGTDFGFGVALRLRALFQETGGDMGANNQVTQLQFDHESAGFVSVTDVSSVVRSIASQLSDGSDTTTTARLGSGTFETPNALQDDVNGSGGGGAFDPAAGVEWEPESSFEIIGADVNDGDTIIFRWLTGGLAPDTTGNAPTLTIDKAVAGGIPPDLGPDVGEFAEVAQSASVAVMNQQ